MKSVCDELIEHPNPFGMSLDEVTRMRFKAIKEVFCIITIITTSITNIVGNMM